MLQLSDRPVEQAAQVIRLLLKGLAPSARLEATAEETVPAIVWCPLWLPCCPTTVECLVGLVKVCSLRALRWRVVF